MYCGAATIAEGLPRSVPAAALAAVAVKVPVVVTAEDGVAERMVPSPVNVTEVTVPEPDPQGEPESPAT